MLQVGRDRWPHLHQQLLQLGIRAGGNQQLIQRVQYGLVIGDLTVDVRPVECLYTLQGYGCPLSAVTAEHPQVCALAQALVEEIAGESVTEECDRSDRPRCRFRIAPSVQRNNAGR